MTDKKTDTKPPNLIRFPKKTHHKTIYLNIEQADPFTWKLFVDGKLVGERSSSSTILQYATGVSAGLRLTGRVVEPLITVKRLKR